jgi:hypothetical protein
MGVYDECKLEGYGLCHYLWTGIALCISQSAMLSGLNLAFFTMSKLELQIEVAKNNKHARRRGIVRKAIS